MIKEIAVMPSIVMQVLIEFAPKEDNINECVNKVDVMFSNMHLNCKHLADIVVSSKKVIVIVDLI
jgi:hypothetical protein